MIKSKFSFDDPGDFLEGLKFEVKVGVKLEGEHPETGVPTIKYGGILESGELDKPYAEAAGQTYAFMAPAIKAVDENIGEFIAEQIKEGGLNAEKFSQNLSDRIEEEVIEEIARKPDFPNTRDNAALKYTFELMRSVDAVYDCTVYGKKEYARYTYLDGNKNPTKTKRRKGN